jgi:hypothetical protein
MLKSAYEARNPDRFGLATSFRPRAVSGPPARREDSRVVAA